MRPASPSPRAWLAPTAALLALFAAGEASATASNKELEAQASELDARLRTVERANQSLVQLSQQIDAARQELRTLLDDHPSIEICGEAENAGTAREWRLEALEWRKWYAERKAEHETFARRIEK